MNAIVTEQTPIKIPLGVAGKPLPIRLLKSTLLRGNNVYHSATVMRQPIDLGQFAGFNSTDAGGDFAERFAARLTELGRQTREGSASGDTLKALQSPAGVPIEVLLMEALMAVERAVAFARHRFHPISFSRIVYRNRSSVDLIWECTSAAYSREAMRVGIAAVAELLPEDLQPFCVTFEPDFENQFATLKARAAKRSWSTTTSVLELAARQRQLPCEPFGGRYLRVGEGAAQRMIYSSITSGTSFAATHMARNKRIANRRLTAVGLPVPLQSKVASAEDACVTATRMGFPVVVKPLRGKQASGVSVGLMSAPEVAAAYERAHLAGDDVIVEEFIAGQSYRMLVVGGRFLAALQFDAPSVTGDGRRTIAELLEQLNADPMRDGVRGFGVEIDDDLIAALKIRGHTLDDVLPDGTRFHVHTAANVALGATHTDVTDEVHEDNRELAERATATIGLDVCGIDFVTPDISRSYKESGGQIIEMNSRPGLCMHTFPRYGKPRNVAAPVLEQAFPAGASGRIPVAVVVGEYDTAAVAKDLDAMLSASGVTTGLAIRAGARVGGEACDLGSVRWWDRARILKRDPRVETLVSTATPRRIMRRGLRIDQCDVAAILNPAPDSDTKSYQRGVEVIIKATRGVIVVSAVNRLAIQLLAERDHRRVILLSGKRGDAPILQHLSEGGVAVVRARRSNREYLDLLCGTDRIASIALDSIASNGSRPGARQIQARMYAMALAHGLGVMDFQKSK